VSGSQNIVTLGTLHYPPNADGIRWFLNEVYPLVLQDNPHAFLTIIGKNPPQDFLEAAERHSGRVKVTGYVPDLVPYFKKAALMVVPVRAGGGMRVRILEAFSWGMPVVTTTIGVEGISAVAGRDLLVEDTPEGFAAAVVRLLRDPQLQSNLSLQCRKLAEEKYDWQRALSPLGKIYQEAARSR
jgi:glycosyltransferase involved in cell wall biosynthesis